DRYQERKRPDEMRRQAPQPLTFPQRPPHQREVEELEVAQTTVHQLRRTRGGAGAEVAAIEERHAESAHGEVPSDARPRHTAADDDDVELGVEERLRTRHHQIKSRMDGSTRSGAISATRGSSARVTPDSTSTVPRPRRLPMTMSVSMRSPTITASRAGTPR